MAIRKANAELPDELDETGKAFERLGIKTKEQLKLSAQQALMDYNTIRNSGEATAEGIEQAHKKAAQAVALSGDAGVIAAFNAADATQKLKVEIDDTGVAAVKSMDEWEKANHRVKDSARGIGDGYRHAGQIAREEAKSSTEAWAEAVDAASAEFDKAMKQQSKALGSLDDYDSYSKSDVISTLKSKGYDEKEAQKLAGSIWSKGLEADRAAKMESYGRGGGAMSTLVRQMFDQAAAKGVTTQNGTNKINELLRSINVASTGSSSLNDYAPSIPSAPSVRDAGQPSKEVTYNFDFNGKQMKFSGPAGQESLMNELVNQLKVQARST